MPDSDANLKRKRGRKRKASTIDVIVPMRKDTLLSKAQDSHDEDEVERTVTTPQAKRQKRVDRKGKNVGQKPLAEPSEPADESGRPEPDNTTIKASSSLAYCPGYGQISYMHTGKSSFRR